MKRLRFFAVISILLFVVFGGFVTPEKTLAVTCRPGFEPNGPTAADCIKIGDTLEGALCDAGSGSESGTIKSGQCAAMSTTSNNGGSTVSAYAGLTNTDLQRWLGYSNALAPLDSVGAVSSASSDTYKQIYEKTATAVYNLYKGNKDVTPTQAFGYILGGVPSTDANITSGLSVAVKQGMINGVTRQAKDKLTAQQVEATLTQMLGTESAYQTQKAQVGSDPDANKNYNTYVNGLNNATQDKVASLQAEKSRKQKCDISWTGFDLASCVDFFFAWVITHTLLQLVGYVLWLTASVMNYAIKIGILDFAKWAPDALYPLWIVMRQIVSLLIVFAGLYLGLMYIIGGKDSERFEKYIPWVIMFALFVNFSYPLARTAVDITNIVSLNVYASAVGGDTLSDTSDNSAGALIRNRLGLIGLVDYATGGAAAEKDGILNGIDSTPVALLAVIFIGAAAYVFFMLSAMIITRTAALIFIIVVSPLLLVDAVIPKLGEQAVKLRQMFFEQLMVGPVFTIMLALTLKFMEVFKQTSGPLAKGTGISVAGASGSNAIEMFFNLTMMLIMLYIMLRVTKATAGAMGKMASDAMGSVGGYAVGAAVGVATGGTGMLARASIGRVAAKARDSGWVRNNRDNLIGRAAHRATNSLANSSFDLRNSSVVAGAAKKYGFSRGMGAGGKLGYEKEFAERQKDIVDRGERIQTRYQEDVKDADGNIIHRKGDIDEAEQRAKERYNQTIGGRRFMTESEKAKTREMLKEKALGGVGKEEGETKKLMDEMLQKRDAIARDRVNADGTVTSVKEQKEEVFAELKAKLEKLKETDPRLQGREAQAVSAAINKIREKKEDDEIALAKQIEDIHDRYMNMGGTPEQQQESRRKLLNSLSKEVRAGVSEKLGGRSPGGPVDIDLSEPAPAPRAAPELTLETREQADAHVGTRSTPPSQPAPAGSKKGLESADEDFFSLV
jgi:hypothetical protein